MCRRLHRNISFFLSWQGICSFSQRLECWLSPCLQAASGNKSCLYFCGWENIQNTFVVVHILWRPEMQAKKPRPSNMCCISAANFWRFPARYCVGTKGRAFSCNGMASNSNCDSYFGLQTCIQRMWKETDSLWINFERNRSDTIASDLIQEESHFLQNVVQKLGFKLFLQNGFSFKSGLGPSFRRFSFKMSSIA